MNRASERNVQINSGKGVRTAFLLLFGLALILRISIAVVAIHNPKNVLEDDSASYLVPAESIYSGSSHGFVGLLRTPGYPIFIALVYAVFGPKPFMIAVVQVGIGMLTMYAAYRIGCLLFFRRISRLGVLLLGFGMETITSTFFVISETLFTCLLALMGLAILKYRQNRRMHWMWLAGAFAGMGILCRPIGLYAPLILVPAVFIIHTKQRIQQLKAACSFLLATGLMLAPWIIRNFVVSGSPAISTVYDKSLLYYEAAAMVADRQKIPLDQAQALLRQLSSKEFMNSGLPDTEISRSLVAARLGRRILFSDPFRYVGLHLRSDLNNFLPGAGYLQQIWGIDNSSFDIWGAVRKQGFRNALDRYFAGRNLAMWLLVPATSLLILVYVGSLAGIAELLKRRDWFSLLFLVPSLAYFLLLPGPASNSRFRVPVMPQLDLLAACGLISIFDRLRRATGGNCGHESYRPEGLEQE